MKRALLIALALIATVGAYASVFRYEFRSTPLSQALVEISNDHPEIGITFIYDQLENYKITASIDTEDATEALRKLTAWIPVAVTASGSSYVVEALQKGVFSYHGRAVDTNSHPVAFATVMLLSPADSTVITYGVTGDKGEFDIPCDVTEVIAKVSCIGFNTAYHKCEGFATGDIVLDLNPVMVGSVTINSDEALLLADKSVYVPQERQKRASLTGYDLLNRMAIPQLRVGNSNGVTTVAGESVSVYIDYIPASSADVDAIRLTDVLRVEYYDYPSDPRFGGKPHVINFITVQYNYGGYVKGRGIENYFVGTSGQAGANAKLQVNRMTYDIGGGAFYRTDHHGNGSIQTETFRLPQPDGGTRTFERLSETTKSDERTSSYWVTAKAAYKSEKAIITNSFATNSWNHPRSFQAGRVTYSPEIMESTEYSKEGSDRDRSIIYNGQWLFYLPHNNTLTLTPTYANTYTTENYLYAEGDLTPIANYAKDNTNQAVMQVDYSHQFRKSRVFRFFSRYAFTGNDITYLGTIDNHDRARTSMFNTGLNYSFKTAKLYAYAGVGWIWNVFNLNSIHETSSKPWADLNINYAFSSKSSANLVFHYSTWPASANLKSDVVLQSSPLMYYTGNPALKPTRSYDLWGQYIIMPTSQLTLSAYGCAWITGNRYAYVYEARPGSILRTIRQPIGSFASIDYGINGSLRLFDSKLQLRGSIAQKYVSDTEPFNYSRFSLSGTAEAMYYHGNFYYGACFTSDSSQPEDNKSGVWINQKGFWWLQAGWGNDNLNVRLFLKNLDRWGWKGDRRTLDTSHYSMSQRELTTDNHALFQITATYTYGFGKKVEHGNEASQLQGAGSAILK